MIRAAAAALALLAGAAGAAPPRLESDALAKQAARSALTPAVRRAVAGRHAGESVDCIDQGRVLATRVVDRSAILWQDRPGRIYVNFPPRGCDTLRGDRAIVTRTGGNRLCQGDMVRVLTPGGNIAGLCRLGRFIPYTR